MEKMSAIVENVEADKICTKNSLQEFCATWKDANTSDTGKEVDLPKHFRGGERGVKPEADGSVGALLLQKGR